LEVGYYFVSQLSSSPDLPIEESWASMLSRLLEVRAISYSILGYLTMQDHASTRMISKKVISNFRKRRCVAPVVRRESKLFNVVDSRLHIVRNLFACGILDERCGITLLHKKTVASDSKDDLEPDGGTVWPDPSEYL
jgi:hypothetical protein